MGNKKEIAESRIPELNNYMKVSQSRDIVNVYGCILVMLYWWELCLVIVALMCFGGCKTALLNYQRRKTVPFFVTSLFCTSSHCQSA